MKLYHGSNIKINNPKIIQNKRSLDFGYGFYLTSDIEQAKKWATRKAKVLETNIGVVSVYDYDEHNDLCIRRFDKANDEWLDFVVRNRKNLQIENEKYDIIIGPVANDQTMQTINLFMRGYIDEKATISMLMVQKLTDQYVFKTDKALEYLKFVESKSYE